MKTAAGYFKSEAKVDKGISPLFPQWKWSKRLLPLLHIYRTSRKSCESVPAQHAKQRPLYVLSVGCSRDLTDILWSQGEWTEITKWPENTPSLYLNILGNTATAKSQNTSCSRILTPYRNQATGGWWVTDKHHLHRI